MQFRLGQELCGFVVKQVRPIEELACNGYELEHVHSGAKLFYLDREDENLVFGVGFRTVPEDSTGVFHILEHCMLNGSERFPLKEPFVNLLKNSLQTFLNAMTYPDKTVYPVASRNEKDFTNLMTVYLDAVFAPLLRTNENVFLQEGWHYELTDPKADPIYKGVVYNEMKGAMSSVFDVLDRAFMAALYPDTCYRHNSGGDPEVIPDLTYDRFVAAYRKYYHADNAMIVLYGTMDVEAKLKLLDEEYLSRFARSDAKIVIERQAPVVNRNAVATYAIGADEDEADNAYCALGWCIGDFSDRERVLAFDVLNTVLLSTNDSPLKKALMEAGIGKDVKGDLVTGVLQPAYVIQLHKTGETAAEPFYTTVRSVFERLVKEGIDRKALTAAINNLEFKLREMETGGFPKGLIFALNMIEVANYGGDFTQDLRYHDAFRTFRAELEHGYFEALLQSLLDSKHYALLTVKPSKTLAARTAEAEAEKLHAYKESLSEADLSALLAQNERLAAFQSAVDTPEQLATLPTLSLSDIDEHPTVIPTETIRADGRTLLYHKVQTDGIAYVNLYYNVGKIAPNDLPILGMRAAMLGKLGTEKHTAEELNNEINLRLGDLNFGVRTFSKDSSACMPMLTASFSCLDERLDDAIDLVREVLDTTVFEEGEVAKILAQKAAEQQIRIVQGGHMAALGLLNARLRASGVYDERLSGIAFYRSLQTTTAAEFIAENAALCCGKDNLTITLTGGEAAKETLLARLSAFEGSADAEQAVSAPLDTGNVAIRIPAGVSYVCKGAVGYRGAYRLGTLRVLEQILHLDYLWGEVRAKGGAYGVGVIAEEDVIRFYSYRDPNVAQTFSAYDAAEDYLANFSCSEKEMTGYIIGTIAGEERALSPRSQGLLADRCYFEGVDEDRQIRTRKEILSTTQEDIRALASLIAKVKEQNRCAVIGNAEKIAASSGFDETADL